MTTWKCEAAEDSNRIVTRNEAQKFADIVDETDSATHSWF
jgi:hypothetical protein